jgi:phage/plasmid primase-like uncharacterized protein
MTDSIANFRAAMRGAGLDYCGPLHADGKLHRIKVEGDKDRNSWFVLHAGPPMGGAFGCWKLGFKDTWCEKQPKDYTDAQWRKIQARWKQMDTEREQEERVRREQARKTAAWIRNRSNTVKEHGYLGRKGVKAHGELREYRGALVLPLRDAQGEIHSLQFISADGDKKFLPGGRVAGCFFTLSDTADGPLVVCEGYATGASIFQATGHAVVCAMNAGNLEAVAKAIRAKQPARDIMVAGDNDQWTTGNPGLTKATAAAKAVAGLIAAPSFKDTACKPTDFNDLHQTEGLDKVKDQVADASPAQPLPPNFLLSELAVPPRGNDPDELLRYRFLCRGGGLLLCGPTGIGKSSWIMQAAILWAMGRECFGIAPARPLKSLLVQAENDDGDLAEMRDGVVAGLGLSPAEAKAACDRITVAKEDSRTGPRFFAEVVRPLLTARLPDILWIDPALAYIGAAASAQEDVTRFLRTELNPLVREFNCAVVVVHHTNKPPTGQEKTRWGGSDFAYLGSGSIEWANWARAVLALRGLGSHDVFELIAAKRGARLNWTETDGVTRRFSKLIAHSKEQGVVCWREASEDEAPQKPGRPATVNAEELFSLLPPEGLTTSEWEAKAVEDCMVSKSTLNNHRRNFAAEGRIAKSATSGKWQPVKRKPVSNVKIIKNTLINPPLLTPPIRGGVNNGLMEAPTVNNAGPVVEGAAKALNGEANHDSLANEIDLAAVKEPADMI